MIWVMISGFLLHSTRVPRSLPSTARLRAEAAKPLLHHAARPGGSRNPLILEVLGPERRRRHYHIGTLEFQVGLKTISSMGFGTLNRHLHPSARHENCLHAAARAVLPSPPNVASLSPSIRWYLPVLDVVGGCR